VCRGYERQPSVAIAVCCSVHCIVLQCVAVRCSALQCGMSAGLEADVGSNGSALKYVLEYLAVCCIVSRLLEAAVNKNSPNSVLSDLCYTLQHCNKLQHTATHCNTLQHTATHCNTQAPRAHFDDNPQYVLRVTAAVDTVVWLVLLQHYPPDAPSNENVAAPSLKLALHTFKGNRKAYNMADDHLKCPWKVSYTPRYASLRLTCPRGEQVQFLKHCI